MIQSNLIMPFIVGIISSGLLLWVLYKITREVKHERKTKIRSRIGRVTKSIQV